MMVDRLLVETATVFAIDMPLRFRSIRQRQGMVWKGSAGWAEWSPFLDYPPAEAANWLRAALEMAESGFPDPVRRSIPVNVTVPATDPITAYRLVKQSGCGTAKVKVAQAGQSLADDLERVEAVRAALGPSGRLRVDANGAWSLDQALTAIRKLSRFDLEYVEQPTAVVADLAKLRRNLRLDSIRIAADESIRRVSDPMAVKRLEAADVIVLKVQPLGGVRACLRLAEELDLPVVVSSAIETSIGLRAGIALAAALPTLPFACGLNTASLLSADLVTPSLQASGGQITVRDITPNADLLTAARANSAVSASWASRLADCWKELDRVDAK
ncbi:MAG: o-succinylbenzoate synthase [Propionibacteriaceae bacterium]|jgi:O-succinylbenzoate synthase|nr:o-succinylbenzoate synthase [Propionibacteriaceae bacterium]